MKKMLFILLLFYSIKTIGCSSCGATTFCQQFINADIIAKVKITQIIKDSPQFTGDGDFLARAEIVTLYKGINNTKNLTVGSDTNSTIGLYLPLNSEWILFAYSTNTINHYYTYDCSGSKQIDRIFDEDFYPNYSPIYKKSIYNLTKLLTNLKANNIEISNKANIINSCGYDNFLKNQNSMESDSDYAFYKVILNSELKIKNIITLSSFNQKFDIEFKKEIIDNTNWVSVYGSKKKIPEDTEWLIIIKKNEQLTYNNLKYTNITYDP